MHSVSCAQAAKLLGVSKRRVLLLTKARLLAQDNEGYYDLEQVKAFAKLRKRSIAGEVTVKVQKKAR